MKRGQHWMALLGLNLFLGLTAVGGGVALLAGWISPPLSALAGSPFGDYTVPGMVLLVVVGGTSLLAGWLVHLRVNPGIAASAISGASIVIFEIVEWNVIGFSWLLGIYLGIGTAILLLAARIQLREHPVHPRRLARPRASS